MQKVGCTSDPSNEDVDICTYSNFSDPIDTTGWPTGDYTYEINVVDNYFYHYWKYSNLSWTFYAETDICASSNGYKVCIYSPTATNNSTISSFSYDNIALTAGLSGVINGETVAFHDEDISKLLAVRQTSSGTASFDYKPAFSGSHTIRAVYAGNSALGLLPSYRELDDPLVSLYDNCSTAGGVSLCLHTSENTNAGTLSSFTATPPSPVSVGTNVSLKSYMNGSPLAISTQRIYFLDITDPYNPLGIYNAPVNSSYGYAEASYLAQIRSGETSSVYDMMAVYKGDATRQLAPAYLGMSLSVETPPLYAPACSVSPNPGTTGQDITFNINVSAVSGGIPPYAYNWTGDCQSSSAECIKSFSSAGDYTAHIQVSDAVGAEVGSDCFVHINPHVWACGEPITDERDNKTYSTVLIGSQCWMAQNLNVGTMVTAGSSQDPSCSTIKKYCYNNDENNCTRNVSANTDGGLYQWSQAMCGVTTPGVKGICPVGWHIPTDAEWHTLEFHFWDGNTSISTCDGTRTTWGCNPAGTYLKSYPGFGALMAGYYNSGFNDSISKWAYFWTSSRPGDYSWYRALYYTQYTVARGSLYKNSISALSVRCVKD
jgi:uncharacterized protein (TIGR02145 family)